MVMTRRGAAEGLRNGRTHGLSWPHQRVLQGVLVHDTQYQNELGKRLPFVSLGPWLGHHRDDRLWLVDESYARAGGPVFLSLDPCRYRLCRAAADGDQAGLALDQSGACTAGRYAALAADRGTRQ